MLPFAWWNPEQGSALGDQNITTEETILILDRVGLIKTSRLQVKTARELIEVSESSLLSPMFTVSETIEILDRVNLIKSDRLRVKTARELIEVSEEIVFVPGFTGSEVVEILDRVILTQTSRLRVKTARELIELSELITFDLDITLAETVEILDRLILIKTSRIRVKTARELILVTETAVDDDISIPIISSCEINPFLDEDEDGFRGRCRFDTGNFCESVRIELNVDSGGWGLHQLMNTTPNTNTNISAWYNGADGEVIQFRIIPFREDGQQGIQGSTCTTGTITLGTGI